MRPKNLDLLLVMLIAALTMLSAFFPGIPGMIKMVLAFPLVFIIPGYLLGEIVLQRRELTACYQLTCSLACSLAMIIAGGFLLNLLPAGLRASTWSFFFAIIATIFSFWILLLRRKRRGNIRTSMRFHLALHDALFLFCALILVVVSLTYTTVGTQQQPTATYTQLWMVPTQEHHQQWQMNLGLQNEESASLQYRLVLSVNGTVTKTWPTISLAPHHAWQQQVSLAQPASNNAYVELRLYRSGQLNSVYREVHATLKSNLATSKS
ncbi:MAG TPA: hypothetical protein VL485_12735 [Ktedonobacteraceae bacterium]|jgi:uncharacterized membrane protein|nr:hypothetical protein [Ktedonobacteraceae bacterium]